MSYTDLVNTNARQYVEFLELKLDINDPSKDEQWASDPNSSGTPKTTDDPAAYTGNDFRPYRYSQTHIANLQHFGSESVKIGNFSTPRADPSKSIGMRANLNVSIKDFVDNDAYSLKGPYVDRAVKGSHFCKLFARNHVKNKTAYVYRGYLVNGLYYPENFKREAYIIDSYQNPSRGVVQFNLVDVLKLSDIKNKKVPEQTNGVVAFDIDSSSTTLTFSPSKDKEYGDIGATGRIAINDEFMDYTIATSTTMTVVRGVGGTVAAEHTAGDTIQLCITNDNYNIIDWFADLIQFSDIPDSYIDTTEWQNLKNNELSSYNLTRTLYKPESIEKYLNELVQVGGLTVWTDVISEKIKIIATPNFDTSVYEFGDHDYKGDTFKITRSDKDHVNSQRILWGKVDPTKTDDYLYKSFQSISSTVAPFSLGYVSFGKEIKTEWLNGLDSLAAAIANREVQRFDRPPFEVEFEVDAKRVYELTNGNYLDIGSVFSYKSPLHLECDRFGGYITRFAQCTSLSQTRDKLWKIRGLSYQANIPSNVDLYIEGNASDVILSDLLQSVSDFVNNVARDYVVVINQGVVLSATNDGQSNYAVNQGAFPPGATLTLVNAGEIIGKGGNGGNGALVIWENGIVPDPRVVDGFAGSDGGSAISFTTDSILNNLTGLIGGGGGGGQGGRSVAGSAFHIAGGGGGGGAGFGNFGTAGKSERNGIEITATDGNQGTKTTGGLGGQYNALSGSPTSLDNGQKGGNLGEVGGGPLGGQAGYAINKNGFSVTINGGNNAEQIKGLIIG